MKNQFFLIAIGLSVSAAALLAQGGGGAARGGAVQSSQAQFEQGFRAAQQANTLEQYSATASMMPRTAVGGRGQVVTGSPLSAKEENKTVQTLSDGTVIENSDVSLFYRDSQGRTRVEQTVEGRTTINITDPVEGFRISINPAAKTAVRTAAPGLVAGAMGRGGAAAGGGRGGAVMSAQVDGVTATARPLAFADTVTLTVAGGGGGNYTVRTVPGANGPKMEDLGGQMQNGVMAQGTRSTLVIPKGQIGNNREIHVVNERWYSKDLQMLVKTINTDPRYGVTTYELTDIAQAAPDPTLFQIPVGYTVTENAGRGGRGGVGGIVTPVIK